MHACVSADSGNRVSEHSSWSEGMLSQDGAASDTLLTPLSEPPSDHTSLLCRSLDLHSNDSPDQQGSIYGELLSSRNLPEHSQSQEQNENQDQEHIPFGQKTNTHPSCPTSLTLPDMEFKTNGDPMDAFAESEPQVAATPDVDMLLECTFSYLQAANEKPVMDEAVDDSTKSQHNVEMQQSEDLHIDFDLPYDPIRPLAYTPEPEPEPSPSSDEEDIYAHGMPSSTSLRDGLSTLSLQGSASDQTQQDKTRLHKADQVREGLDRMVSSL